MVRLDVLTRVYTWKVDVHVVVVVVVVTAGFDRKMGVIWLGEILLVV